MILPYLYVCRFASVYVFFFLHDCNVQYHFGFFMFMCLVHNTNTNRKVALRNELRGPSGAKTSLPANVEGELAALIKTSAAYWLFLRID
jgi:hypothetical protein